MQFVGKIFTDGLTDGIRSSEYLLSVISHSIANFVGNKKNQTLTVLQTTKRAQKKKFPQEFYRWNNSICIFNGNHRRNGRR
jgi:hypothetical protein